MCVTDKLIPYSGWIDVYGPLTAIRSGINKIVIIGRHKVRSSSWVVISISTFHLQATMDIMERQGGLLADRRRMVAVEEILIGCQSLTFTHVGDRFRRMRRYGDLQPKANSPYLLSVMQSNTIPPISKAMR